MATNLIENKKLTEEWNYEKNQPLTPEKFTIASNKKVWWKCSKGHEWESIIANRARLGRGCPVCAGKKVIKGENDFATFYPHLLKEWNFEKNKNITPESFTSCSNKKVWWKCANGHEWESVISNRTVQKKGCPYCCGQKRKKGADIYGKFNGYIF